jgi:hypothetical protein
MSASNLLIDTSRRAVPLLCAAVAWIALQESANAANGIPVLVENPVTVANPVHSVTVNNPSTSPVPVTVTNPTVTVGNTVPVTGNVGITGTPNVNVTNTVPVTGNVGVTGTVMVTNPVGTVTVGNTNASPIPVTVTNTLPAANVNDSAKTAFISEGYGSVTATVSTVGAAQALPIAQIPAGNRLVVENVSVTCTAFAPTTGAGPYLVQIQYALNTPTVFGGYQPLNVPIQSQGSDGLGDNYFVGSLATRVYVDHTGGSDVLGYFYSPAGSGTTACNFYLSGHLVPYP